MEFFKSRYFYIGLLVTLVTVGAFLLGISFQVQLANSFLGISSTLFTLFCLYKLGAIFGKPLGCLFPVLAIILSLFLGFLNYRGSTIERWPHEKGHVESYTAVLGFTDAVVAFDIYETLPFFTFLEKHVGTAQGRFGGQYSVKPESAIFEGLNSNRLIYQYPFRDSIIRDTVKVFSWDCNRYF